MNHCLLKIISTFFLLCAFAASAGAVCVTDDTGQVIRLAKPAERIISTAPHITEFLYEAGGREKIAGVTSHSDFPEEAKKLPLVGDNRQIDIERVLTLKPDLLIAWKGGNPPRQIEKLRQLGIPVFYSDPKKIEDIPETLIRFGKLIGEEKFSTKKATAWQERLLQLKQQYQGRSSLRVFYQISENPLYTLNGRHIVSEAMHICGGKNIFSELPITAPQVSVESVLVKNPEVIFISSSGGSQNGIRFWQKYRTLDAVRKKSIYTVNPDLIDRPSPRFIEGVAFLCEKIDAARAK